MAEEREEERNKNFASGEQCSLLGDLLKVHFALSYAGRLHASTVLVLKIGSFSVFVQNRYGEYTDAIDTGIRTNVWCFDRNHEVGFFHCIKDGVDYMFVDNPAAYLRAGTFYSLMILLVLSFAVLRDC